MVTIGRPRSTALILTLTLAWSGSLTFAAMTRGEAEAATGPRAQKVTREEIFDVQNKQEQAGSAAEGRPIFEKVCAACHRFGEAIGTDVGPDLTTITSRFKKRDVLEAILWPSRTISDQYKSEMFELKDGAIVSGVVVRENAANVFVRTATTPEKPVAVPKAQIANRAESAVSLMPEGLLDAYSQTDISNLLAFMLAPPPAK